MNMKTPVFLSLACGLIVIGAAIRFWDLDYHTLWYDEIETTLPRLDPATGRLLPDRCRTFQDLDAGFFRDLPRARLFELPRYAERVSSYPPLYYGCITLWRGVFGDSDAALRAFSALAGTAAMVLFLLLALSVLERQASVVALLLFAVQPFLVAYSRAARPYALLLLLTTASLCLLVRLIRDPGRWGLLAIFALVNAAILYTHYFGLLFVIAQIAPLLLIKWRDFRLLGSYLISGLLFVPGLMIAIHRFAWFGQKGHSSNWHITAAGKPYFSHWVKGLQAIPTQLLAGHIALGHQLWAVFFLVLALLALVYLLWKGFVTLKKQQNPVAVVLLCEIVIPVMGMMGVDLAMRTDVSHVPRYLICVVPPLLLLAAQGTAGRRIIPWIAAVVLAGMFIAGLFYFFTHPWMSQDWRSAAELVRVREGPGSYLAVDNYHQYLLMIRYGGGKQRIAWEPEVNVLEKVLRDQPGAHLVYVPSLFSLPNSSKRRIAATAQADPSLCLSLVPPDLLRLEPLVTRGVLKLERILIIPATIPLILVYRVSSQSDTATGDSSPDAHDSQRPDDVHLPFVGAQAEDPAQDITWPQVEFPIHLPEHPAQLVGAHAGRIHGALVQPDVGWIVVVQKPTVLASHLVKLRPGERRGERKVGVIRPDFLGDP